MLFYNKNKWVRAENNSETKKCTKSCDEISIAIPKIVDGKKNQVNFTDALKGKSVTIDSQVVDLSYVATIEKLKEGIVVKKGKKNFVKVILK